MKLGSSQGQNKQEEVAWGQEWRPPWERKPIKKAYTVLGGNLAYAWNIILLQTTLIWRNCKKNRGTIICAGSVPLPSCPYITETV